MADDKAVAEFYGKRTVTIAVGFSPGGNYDLYARLVARHIGQHIPGKPIVVVQNLPGAGSRRLANVLSNVGPHDGTTIGLPNQASRWIRRSAPKGCNTTPANSAGSAVRSRT